MKNGIADKTGMRFGKLVVIGLVCVKNSVAIWRCKCDCGNETSVYRGKLTSGQTKSCGCTLRTHEMSSTKTYKCWQQMHQNCSNEKRRAYKNYGGRGIKVCERWQRFETFLADMGEKQEGEMIRRIDKNGNFEPGNCKWVIDKSKVRYEFNGKKHTIAQWSKEVGISIPTLRYRLLKGKWSVERALTEKVHEKRKKV